MTSMSASPTAPIDPEGVYFIDDVAARLSTSRRTIERQRAQGCFPIPELASIDKRPRWSGRSLLEYLDGQRGRLRRAS